MASAWARWSWARAGLLDGRRFTTHWYYRRSVLERHPRAIYVPDQRYVIDRDVATTTGVTATMPTTMPTMLALVEAIGGRAKAQALAGELGVRLMESGPRQLALRTQCLPGVELSSQ